MAAAFQDNLLVLGMRKQIYFHALPVLSFAIAFARLAEARLGGATTGTPHNAFIDAVIATPNGTTRVDALCGSGSLKADPHTVYPVSIYRQCDDVTSATQVVIVIEAVMSTSGGNDVDKDIQ